MTGNIQPLFAVHGPRGRWRFNLQAHPSTTQVASSKRLSNVELYRHVPTAEIVEHFVEHFMEVFAAQYLTPQELRECRTDHEWELERRVFDFVACRRCGLKCRTDLTAELWRIPRGSTRRGCRPDGRFGIPASEKLQNEREHASNPLRRNRYEKSFLFFIPG